MGPLDSKRSELRLRSSVAWTLVAGVLLGAGETALALTQSAASVSAPALQSKAQPASAPALQSKAQPASAPAVGASDPNPLSRGAADTTAARQTLPVLVPEPARRALAAIGWRPEDLHIDLHDADLYGGGPRLPLYDDWMSRPFAIPGDIAIFEDALVKSVQKPADLTIFAGVRLGHGVRRGLIDDPVKALVDSLSHGDPLERALEAVWRAGEFRRSGPEASAAGGFQRSGPGASANDRRTGRDRAPGFSRDPKSAVAALSRLPLSWHRPIAIILAAEAEAARWRDLALLPVELPPIARARPDLFTGSSPDEAPDVWLYRQAVRYVTTLDSDGLDPAFLRGVEETAMKVDPALLQAGATDLLRVLETEVPQLERAAASRDSAGAAPAVPLRVETPLGAIVIGTRGADAYPAGDYLLIIDPAGDDHYQGGAAGTPWSPVSVLIDLAGSDAYDTADSTRPAFGAGVTGIGILIDREGEDRYHGVNLCLGAGLCGVGVLADRSGNDTYDAFTACEGAGLFGIGILADSTGNDRYHAFQQAQGYGYVLGSGLLIDAEGDDEYWADDQAIRFPAAQSKEHNSSLAQGFGFGKRADYTDGHSLPGGFGMLADGAGNDHYHCGIFGQGAGYWYGIGVLADGAGDDTYDGVWYTQGAAAHFAIGALWEGGGNDRYRSTMNMALGAGHDFSLGLLYDRSGRDLYQAPNLSLGAGNANGFGIFWDQSGDDRYEVEAASSLGRSNVDSRGGLRDRMKSLGLFLDTGGRDTYPASKPFAGDDRIWVQGGTNTQSPLATEAGVGIDTEWSPPAR